MCLCSDSRPVGSSKQTGADVVSSLPPPTQVNCIGCGKCVRSCPDAFFIEGSKYGRARVLPGVDALELQEEVEVAMLTCPVDCIHWVGVQQQMRGSP